jgi:hypothetical protein
MKRIVEWLLICILGVFYLSVLWCLVHPHISQAYREYFIDRTTTDWADRFDRYPSTPDQGVKFNTPGLPAWIDHTYGMSYREEWGRWTDSGVTKSSGIAFRNVLSGPICMHLVARPVSPLVNQSVSVKMGNVVRSVTLDSGDAREYDVSFPADTRADRLDFVLPALPSASSADSRHLGLALTSLTLSEGACQ